MEVRGAIFDCDGTILDSMPMWTSTCVELLERYGVEDAPRVFAEHESLDMDKKCYWYHDNLGIGESGDALYRELWSMVSKAYAERVHPYEGCTTFLRELAQAEVPCVIVSSTPTELLRGALRQHGLLGYFEEIIFVGDVGRGKEYSDCYVEAGRRLGTPRCETWVFEDAPFGVRSAARAGFPTVAILNDHDGRDEAFMELWGTVVARSYAELSLRGLCELGPHVVKALVVAGSPLPSTPGLVRGLVGQSDFVIAADKGVDVLHAAEVVPDVYCGDEDSAGSEALRWAKDNKVRWELHPTEKDDTDLGLAIACARRCADERGSALEVTVTCASGGRPDHALGVWGVLARCADACPRVVEDDYECRILSTQGNSTWLVDNRCGATASVIALMPGSVVTICGMQWNLQSAKLRPLDDYGVSNRILEEHALVRCEAGVLAVFVLNGGRV